MSQVERPIIITNDLDGVHFSAYPPLGTTFRLLRGNWILPDEVHETQEYTPPIGLVKTALAILSILLHRYQPLKPTGIRGLQRFREIGESHQRDLSFAVLSGREQDKLDVTRSILGKAGYDQYFSRWLLNKSHNPAGWKEFQTRELTREGFTVVHLEDDLRAGLGVARVNQQFGEELRVFVYLFRNLSNHPRLLRRANIELPSNLIFIKDFQEANQDFAQRLSTKSL